MHRKFLKKGVALALGAVLTLGSLSFGATSTVSAGTGGGGYDV